MSPSFPGTALKILRTRLEIDVNPLPGGFPGRSRGPGHPTYLAVGVELGFMAFFFFFIIFFLCFIDLATGVLTGVVSAQTGPETAPTNKIIMSAAINFFMAYSLN